MNMLTNSADIRPVHRVAVLHSIDIVNTVTRDDFGRPTPCGDWTLLDLLAHMTVQHRGFAAAARGAGADLENWNVDSVVDAVRADHASAYADAALDVIDAFAADGTPEALFGLPEFGAGAAVPGAMAMGFHFVDYVVHGWDVAASLGLRYELPADVIAAALPLVLAVPDGEFRSGQGAPFGPAIEGPGGENFDRVLSHLGRRPDWAQRYSTATRR
ncbi:TIGR03086 family metal-binding protein [Mycobacterium sp. Aquia_213]|uniref:TIGR03086 family metal-binding protein n=1 Tax=Mycobacterium sp. Aquia_213 TaxID=2991728 RepID=UPI00226D6217|nr:TIGR03086 family metal-binding protein [Mycobacterium sp. Aquia_213]WAC92548.1 TIGR03086 family metal-binding protein [Mycobacterium sp. Aquia_213]